MSESIYTEYFSIAKEKTQQYGEKTVLLMQVGAFFEIYGISPQTHLPSYQYRIFDVCKICDLNVSEKKTTFEGSALYMAGFRDFTSEKYIQRLVQSSYTVVVYVQEKNEKNTRRIFHAVYSPGTYLPFEADAGVQLTNHIMCIWIETYSSIFRCSSFSTQDIPKSIIYGVAISNIYTGKSAMFEHQMPYVLNTTTFDELERLVAVYSPSEVILCSDLGENIVAQIIQFAGIRTHTIHQVRLDEQKAVNCTKQTYIQHVLSSQFNVDTYQVCSEFTQYPIATQAYCYLLHFIKEHNPNLIRNIGLPVFENTSTRMVLANHTLKQLNIIDDGNHPAAGGGGGGGISSSLSSVASFLNKCCSSVGRRQFHSVLVSPVFDTKWLEKEYSMVEHMLDANRLEMLPMFRKNIGAVCDVEKVSRQLVSRRIYPSLIYKLYKSIEILQQTHLCLFEDTELVEYLCSEFHSPLMTQYKQYNHKDLEKPSCAAPSAPPTHQVMEWVFQHVLFTITHYLYIDHCAYYNSLSGFDDNIICSGISPELDQLIQMRTEDTQKIQQMIACLNDAIRAGGGDPSGDYVKLHETEKSSMTLQITKTRGKILKKVLEEGQKKETQVTGVSDPNKLRYSEISLKPVNASMDEIRIPQFAVLANNLFQLKTKINDVILREYSVFLNVFEQNCFVCLDLIAKYIAKLDILQSKVYVAKEYNYCRPQIASAPAMDGDTLGKSFVQAEGLRHCLIEQIQRSEIYVANDLTLGAFGAPDGILLFGTNAVGKTSIIRALGIAVIMAQCGMFVPCQRFVYSPYSAIFSRILGNDNIFKGLSTFAVEMTELRMILNTADANSLILGDELCSGTETESALSIFMAGLMDLHAKQSSFLFATHFHEILRFDEMRALPRVALKHMSVLYDRERDCLVYDRKLADGAGNRMYGLEVCKSLHLPQPFLDKAYQIRTKYFPNAKGELEHTETKYHSAKIKGLCENCLTNIGEDVHHLQEQHLANENGYIGHFHKNHPANLMVLCETCHHKIHHSPLSSPPKPPTETTAPANVTEKPKRVYRKKTTAGKMVV